MTSNQLILLPCSRCGKPGSVILKKRFIPSVTHNVYCYECNTQAKPFRSQQAAINAWNKIQQKPQRCGF